MTLRGPLILRFTCVLRSAGPATLIVRFFVILAFERFGLKAILHSRFAGSLLLLFFLLQLLPHGLSQIDFSRIIIISHRYHLLWVKKGAVPILNVFKRAYNGNNDKAAFATGNTVSLDLHGVCLLR